MKKYYWQTATSKPKKMWSLCVSISISKVNPRSHVRSVSWISGIVGLVLIPSSPILFAIPFPDSAHRIIGKISSSIVSTSRSKISFCTVVVLQRLRILFHFWLNNICIVNFLLWPIHFQSLRSRLIAWKMVHFEAWCFQNNFDYVFHYNLHNICVKRLTVLQGVR